MFSLFFLLNKLARDLMKKVISEVRRQVGSLPLIYTEWNDGYHFILFYFILFHFIIAIKTK